MKKKADWIKECADKEVEIDKLHELLARLRGDLEESEKYQAHLLRDIGQLQSALRRIQAIGRAS